MSKFSSKIVFKLLDYQDPPNYEFRLATNQDARSSMSQELENILRSCPGRCCQTNKIRIFESRDVLFEFHLKYWNTASIDIPARSLL